MGLIQSMRNLQEAWTLCINPTTDIYSWRTVNTELRVSKKVKGFVSFYLKVCYIRLLYETTCTIQIWLICNFLSPRTIFSQDFQTEFSMRHVYWWAGNRPSNGVVEQHNSVLDSEMLQRGRPISNKKIGRHSNHSPLYSLHCFYVANVSPECSPYFFVMLQWLPRFS